MKFERIKKTSIQKLSSKREYTVEEVSDLHEDLTHSRIRNYRNKYGLGKKENKTVYFSEQEIKKMYEFNLASIEKMKKIMYDFIKKNPAIHCDDLYLYLEKNNKDYDIEWGKEKTQRILARLTYEKFDLYEDDIGQLFILNHEARKEKRKRGLLWDKL